jgi:coenzyme F420-reducing hydrogenase delta subunit/formate hydrogenlyase subunit 6/NADH:ubiquinone oxidoreductase subunit I
MKKARNGPSREVPVAASAGKPHDSLPDMRFGRLSRWASELNICIRCGYCSEHCPLYRLSGWEIDTPRGRLLLSYGLLTGEVEPSPYVAEKLFECFYCQNCSKSCSAKVSPTAILTDARADLLEAGFDVQGTTVRNDERLCRVCGRCVELCKAEALSIDTISNRVLVDSVKCKGCGVCVAECPVGAMSQQEGFGVSRRELAAALERSLRSLNGSPKVVVFCCNWSITPGLQLSRLEPPGMQDDSRIIVTVCAGRVDPRLILDAFCQGAWGVMIACCPLDECEQDGNYRAKDRCVSVGSLLGLLGVESRRLKLEYFATGEAQKLKNAVKSFAAEMASLGPV